MNLSITKEDVKLLRDILENWDILSKDTKAYECMTDHCHVEFDMGDALAIKMENIIEISEKLGISWVK